MKKKDTQNIFHRDILKYLTKNERPRPKAICRHQGKRCLNTYLRVHKNQKYCQLCAVDLEIYKTPKEHFRNTPRDWTIERRLKKRGINIQL